jgi:hypothetical protein
MKRLMLMAPCALLFACSGSAESLQAGQWETTVHFTSIDLPGAPPAAVAPMRAAMTQPQVRSDCMTAEQAANPTARMMNTGTNPNACQFTDNVFTGGTIRVHGTCQDPARGSMQISWDGSYTATTMTAQVTTEMHAPAGTQGPQTIRMSGTMTGRRTGDCPAAH